MVVLMGLPDRTGLATLLAGHAHAADIAYLIHEAVLAAWQRRPLVAVFVSSALFVLAHLSNFQVWPAVVVVNQVCYAFFIGIGFATADSCL